jgi:Uma2 family endonuclease
MSQVHSELIRSDEESTPATSLSHPDALYEIVDGLIAEQPEISFYAARIATILVIAMGKFLEDRDLGQVVCEAIYVLDRTRNLRRRPDVSFLSQARWPMDQTIPEEGDLDVVPDLAVEVISPNDPSKDVVGKLNEYFAHGVREVWHVYPSLKQVWVFTSPTSVRILGHDDTIDGGDLLPGFRVPAAALFRR